MNMPLVYGINFGNPEMHDMENVLHTCAQQNKIYYGGIPKHDNEELKEYFKRLLKASRKDDRSMLLLSYGTNMIDRGLVIEAWQNANRELF